MGKNNFNFLEMLDITARKVKLLELKYLLCFMILSFTICEAQSKIHLHIISSKKDLILPRLLNLIQIFL